MHLCRSIDLARTWRCQSQVGSQLFILTQRKGQRGPQWEAVVSTPACPAISPTHLINRYVHLTAHLVPAGSELLRQVAPPYKPLVANTVGSITKRLLAKFGVSTTVWGPHSTRGAGVLHYKSLGMTSEEVCEIGKWKNTSAFTSHYLRLGASKKAGERLSAWVHNVSPGLSAEPDRSRSPETDRETGRSDREGEARGRGEPTPPPGEEHSVASKGRKPPSLKRNLSSSSAEGPPLKFAFAKPN